VDKIVIEGGIPLHGTVHISGAKNAALPIFAAALITGGVYRITNVPALRDVTTIASLLTELGAKVENPSSGVYVVDTREATGREATYDLVKTMRASCLALGPLLARFGRAKVSMPGGCAIGERPIDLHLKGLAALGARINLDHGYVEVDASNGLKGTRITMDLVTVTGVMNIMMAATRASGTTVIENAAREPEVVALADFLNSMGARISGAGTAEIKVEGVEELYSADVEVIPDRIEAGTYLVAGAITGGAVDLEGIIPAHLANIVDKLRECGCDIKENTNGVSLKAPGEILPTRVTTSPYPGFPTDMQAQIMALLTLSRGASVIVETIFENRFMHVAELRRMGADITVVGNTATVKGVKGLSGAPLMATDLRASASLALAGLAASGTSTIARVYHLDRGYEKIEEKLKGLGAVIYREKA